REPDLIKAIGAREGARPSGVARGPTCYLPSPISDPKGSPVYPSTTRESRATRSLFPRQHGTLRSAPRRGGPSPPACVVEGRDGALHGLQGMVGLTRLRPTPWLR